MNAGSTLTLTLNSEAGVLIAGGAGHAAALSLGDNTLSLKVVSADGTASKTYAVSVHRTRPELAFESEQADLRFHAAGAEIVPVVLPAAADSGVPPYAYALGGTLPSSLAYAALARTLSGTADAVSSLSTAPLTYTLSDSAVPSSSVAQEFTVSLSPPPALASSAPSTLDFTFNTAVSGTVLPALSGGFEPYAYSLEGEALLAGPEL